MTDAASRPGALSSALQRRDTAAALHLLAEAEAERPLDVDLLMQLAVARQMTGELAAALDTLDRALVLDPYHFPALLSKGAVVEKLHGAIQAAPIYRNALLIAPREHDLATGLLAGLRHARAVADADASRLQAYLRERTAALREKHGSAATERFDEGLDIFAGVKRAFRQEPILLTYPGLPATPFYDRGLFPWLEQLEAGADLIRTELQALLGGGFDGFAPYIQYPPGVPVNQWGELNHSRRWSSLFLWRDGVRQDQACALCPGTAALLESLPMMRQEAFAPTVTFSALQPHTHIPPHTGSSNTRLLVHLPLILPGPARFRVGNQVRAWTMGQAWVFDDTIEHEAWNDADEMRVILIFDIWNPHLSGAERELVAEMMAAKNAYLRGSP